MHELIYPILQGFDSVKINCDIEMGGTDQLFNCTMGRQLQESYSLNPQIVMCMPLLKGLDGKEKMSKSLNNIIGLTDSPNDMFGKTMSIPDELIPEFLELTTDFTPEEKQQLLNRLLAGENPMLFKKMIARNIISQYHSIQEAEQAEQFFFNQFQNKNEEEKIFMVISTKNWKIEDDSLKLLDLCHQLKTNLTRSALRRLIENGAVHINNQKISDPHTSIGIANGLKIKIGKRDFYELI